MRDILRNKCDLFADNYMELKNSFRWNYSTNNRLAALLYTMESRKVNIDAIKWCRNMIKENTGLFSQFKDTANFMTSTMLSLQENPTETFQHTLGIYRELKDTGLHSSAFLVIAALTIALQSKPEDYQRVIKGTKDFYSAMKKEHRLITSFDDYGYAALLALTGQSVDQAVREMESCYWLLKPDFSYSNAVQSLSHVLAFSDENANAKCKRIVDLYQALKNRNLKYGKGLELSFLGITALLKADTQQLANEIMEVNHCIENKKGFGMWSISNRERLMFSVALVCDDYLDSMKKETMEFALANNIAAILLAQQTAAVAAATGATASAAAASN